MEDSVEANKRQKVEEQPAPVPLFNIEGNREPIRLNMYMYSSIKYQESIIVYNFVIGDTSIRTGHLCSKNLLTLEIIKRKMRNFLEVGIEADSMRLPPRGRWDSINAPVFDGEGNENILNSYLKYRELMKEHPESAFILNNCIAPCKDAFRKDPYDIGLITDRNRGLYILETLSTNLLLEFFDCIQCERPPSKNLPYEIIGQLSFTRHNKYDTLI